MRESGSRRIRCTALFRAVDLDDALDMIHRGFYEDREQPRSEMSPRASPGTRTMGRWASRAYRQKGHLVSAPIFPDRMLVA